MQKQLDGLLKFCSLNLMSGNEIKTKCMVIGSKGNGTINLAFNNNDIEHNIGAWVSLLDQYVKIMTICL